MRATTSLKLACLAVVALAGCGRSADSVKLSVDVAAVSAGGTLQLSLDNRSWDQVGYNFCNSTLVRVVNGADDPNAPGSQWDVRPLTACALVEHLLPAFQKVSEPYIVPAGSPTGTYRLRSGIDVGGERAVLPTQTFEVTQ